jgi:hypothetical protein
MPEQLQRIRPVFEVDQGGDKANYNRAGSAVGNDGFRNLPGVRDVRYRNAGSVASSSETDSTFSSSLAVGGLAPCLVTVIAAAAAAVLPTLSRCTGSNFPDGFSKRLAMSEDM